jgi:hypothetical protein
MISTLGHGSIFASHSLLLCIFIIRTEDLCIQSLRFSFSFRISGRHGFHFPKRRYAWICKQICWILAHRRASRPVLLRWRPKEGKIMTRTWDHTLGSPCWVAQGFCGRDSQTARFPSRPEIHRMDGTNCQTKSSSCWQRQGGETNDSKVQDMPPLRSGPNAGS